MGKRKLSDAEIVDALYAYAQDCDCDVQGIDTTNINDAMYSLTETIDGLVSRSDREECGVYKHMIACGAWEKD